jgi:hypothetical protein
MPVEELAEIERAGRRCSVCHTGRRWRQFEIVRHDGQEPVVMCAACRARYGDAPPVPEAPEPAPAPTPKAQAAPDATPRPRQNEDRLKKALRELPRGEHSTGRIAKAAGLKPEKALGRLRALEAAGEIQQIGRRWSNEPPSTDVEAAMDRLQARTSNLRIVR